MKNDELIAQAILNEVEEITGEHKAIDRNYHKLKERITQILNEEEIKTEIMTALRGLNRPIEKYELCQIIGIEEETVFPLLRELKQEGQIFAPKEHFVEVV